MKIRYAKNQASRRSAAKDAEFGLLRKSNSIYKTLFESITDMIFIVNTKTGLILDGNGAALSATLYEGQELRKMKFIDLAIDLDDGSILPLAPDMPPAPLIIQRKDGEIIYCEAVASPLLLKTEKLAIISVRDVTLRRQIENELEKSNEFNQAVFEYSPIRTVVVDRAGRIVKYNLAKKNSGDRLPNIGDRMYIDYAGKHGNDMRGELMASMSDGQIRDFPEQKYADDCVSVKIAPFSGGAIITTLKITKRKLAEAALKKSENKYRQLFENSPLGIISADTEGNITDINSALIRIFGGKSKEDAPKINIFTYPAFIKAGITANFSKSIFSGEFFTAECPYSTIWEKFLYIRYYITPHFDDLGKIIGAQILVEDITERKQAREIAKKTFLKMEKAKKEWETTVDTLSSIVCLVDPKNRIIRANRAVESWGLGKIEEVHKRTINKLFHPVCRGTCELKKKFAQATAAIQAGKEYKTEFFDQRLNKHLSIEARPIFYKNRSAESEGTSVFVVTDVSREKQSMEKLIELYKHLGVINRRLAVLADINQTEKTGNLAKAAAFIIESASSLSRSGMCRIYSRSGRTKSFKFYAANGQGARQSKAKSEISAHENESLQKLLRSKRYVQITKNSPDFSSFSCGKETNYILLLPLSYEGGIFGFLMIGFKDKESISTQELNFYNIFAIHSARSLRGLANA